MANHRRTRNRREDLKKDLESGMKTTENITGKRTPERGDGIPFHFDRINLTFDRKELVAIVGSVASDKSSFLAALAGDMRMTSGIITQSSAMAYCPQYAWIQNASIKDILDKILTRKDSRKLLRVVHSESILKCCLMEI
jgi:ATP-binding cassette, subfamily C (CFTR/MRP), member 1